MGWAMAVWASLFLLWSVPAWANDCSVRGLVYGSAEVAEVDARVMAPDFCHIATDRFERRIVMQNEHWRVEVVIPAELKGWVRFYYLWGYGLAYFGSQPIPVEAHPIVRG